MSPSLMSPSPPSNSDEDDDDDNDNEDGDDEGEEKEEKYDEERLAAFRLYLSFFLTVPPLLRPSPASLCTLLSYSFISFLLRCSMNEVGQELLRLIPACILSPRLSPQTSAA